MTDQIQIPTDKLLKPIEVACILGLVGLAKDPERAVLEMGRRGELQPVRVSKWTLIHPASVRRYLNPGRSEVGAR